MSVTLFQGRYLKRPVKKMMAALRAAAQQPRRFVRDAAEHAQRACAVIAFRNPVARRNSLRAAQQRANCFNAARAFGKKRQVYPEPEMAFDALWADGDCPLARAYPRRMQLPVWCSPPFASWPRKNKARANRHCTS